MKLSLHPTLLALTLLGLASSAYAHHRVRLDFEAGADARPPLWASPAVTTSPVGYSPSQVRHAYGFDLLAYGGSGQTIAIVDAYGSPTIQNDLNVFSRQYGLPAATVKIVNSWTVSSLAPVLSDAGWALETSLDVEWAHAIAPKAAILVVVARSASYADLLAAVDAAVKAGATVITMSWGGAEFSAEGAYDSHFQKSGVTFLAASGDNGSGAMWPAASPSVVSVGGTSLYLNSSGSLTSPEKGWSGSGGGFSAYFARPSYQSKWQSNARRAIPDVSIIADPNTGVAIYDSTPYSGLSGWFEVGGTSLSTPVWGAVIALANEQRNLSRSGNLTGSTSALYTLAGATGTRGASLYSSFFFDVTVGSNGGYGATAKFDEVTGLGTPVAPNVATNLGK